MKCILQFIDIFTLTSPVGLIVRTSLVSVPGIPVEILNDPSGTAGTVSVIFYPAVDYCPSWMLFVLIVLMIRLYLFIPSSILAIQIEYLHMT